MTLRSWIAAGLLSLGVGGAWGQGVPNQGIGVPNAPPAIVSVGNAISIATYGASAAVSDNATAIQAAINAAVAAGKSLYIPAAASCYKYTAPLTISGNLQVVGDYVSGNFNAGTPGINTIAPFGSPPLLGSVLCPTSNGSDGIDINGTQLTVNFVNIGLTFQTPFSGTGDAIHYVPATAGLGLMYAFWQNVMVYGHDGNHYAFNLQNPVMATMSGTFSFGGGSWNILGNSAASNAGNLTIIESYGATVVGGSANCTTLTANATQRLNLITFIRPQCFVINLTGVTPGGNAPTSAQDIWHEDANVTYIRKVAPDFETNVASGTTLGSPAVGNDADFGSLLSDGASISAPAWTTAGIMYGPQQRTFTDTTSTGTVAVEAFSTFPGNTLKAANAITVTNLAALYLGLPIAGTNVTAGTTWSLYAVGAIFTNQSIITNGGAFIKGTTQINVNNGANTTSIGQGTTSGQVNIGSASGFNTVALGSTVTLAGTLTASALSTVGTIAGSLCATSAGLILYESGASSCTISLLGLKKDVRELDWRDATSDIMSLKPISYAMKEQPEKQRLGFFAENTKAVDERFATYDGNGDLQAYDPNAILSASVAMLQKLKADNDNLQACMQSWKCRLFGVR